MKKSISLLLTAFFLVSSLITFAQKLHSDNGNGTYTNPVIAADFPDPDVIRVGDSYYMVTTTMFIFPGVTVLKSHDLVNWEYCSNAFSTSVNVTILMVVTGTAMANGLPALNIIMGSSTCCSLLWTRAVSCARLKKRKVPGKYENCQRVFMIRVYSSMKMEVST